MYRSAFTTSLYPLVLILFSFCFSCSEPVPEPAELRVENQQIDVVFRDSVHTGASSDFEISYAIHDPYIVTIDGDFFKGLHVGSTIVTASSNGKTEELLVNVNSRSKLFEYPFKDFSKGKEYYRKKYEGFNKLQETSNAMQYLVLNYSEKDAYIMTIYFTPENTTEAIVFTFVIGLASKVMDNISEHFEVWYTHEDGFYFINAFEIEQATDVASLELDRKNQYCHALFMPVENLEATSLSGKSLQLGKKRLEKQNSMHDFSILKANYFPNGPMQP